ncbi:RsmD family RNA methyltransferase [Bdellovibrio bacteriovorus]|uniref:RsmD family RNA methyltransferase n=1 Tax=Bdellovibrio bacteriovorus TaxID=959 RepID=UPI0021CFC604|nr:RsmD family RNA methyltransferase [Bdellovibrio bacteriovorus]UXR66032.1 RsmD family RNA methyltransferase [Bdellovibrio bacteriovorus]
MSSINPHFTFNYVQPEEYRFSHDSVFLAREVFELLEGSLTPARALDLCSGCGIIGLDFLFHCRQAGRPLPAQFDFLEVQSVYQTYFAENLKSFGAGLPSVSFINQNYEVLKSPDMQGRYDLILSNPPYFRLNQGKMSPSEFKNRCRFFIDSDFKNLIEAIDNALSPQGQAYILLRDLQDHGWNPLNEARKILAGRRDIQQVADIRGTPVVRIS